MVWASPSSIWYGESEVIAGKTTPGTFMSFLACVLLLYDPVRKLSHLNNTIQQGLAAADRVFDIIETPSDILDPASPAPIIPGPHEVSFEGVHFSYGEKEVLTGIDLKIDKGQVLALVGMSGGGKSTIANLIPRFFDVTGGHIRIDGIDVRDIAVPDPRPPKTRSLPRQTASLSLLLFPSGSVHRHRESAPNRFFTR